MAGSSGGNSRLRTAVTVCAQNQPEHRGIHGLLARRTIGRYDKAMSTRTIRGAGAAVALGLVTTTFTSAQAAPAPTPGTSTGTPSTTLAGLRADALRVLG